MKPTFETVVVFLKGWFVTSGAAASAFAAGISQLPKEVTTLLGITLPVWGLLCSVYGAFSLSAIGFLSNSFGDYQKGRQSQSLTPPAIGSKP